LNATLDLVTNFVPGPTTPIGDKQSLELIEDAAMDVDSLLAKTEAWRFAGVFFHWSV
jgi:hypothetical protein